MTCPILALQAGDDQHITAEDNAAFEQALAAAGVEHEVVTYDGAPHSFFDRKYEEFADASADAWRRTLEFIAQPLVILAIDQGTTGTTCLVVDEACACRPRLSRAAAALSAARLGRARPRGDLAERARRGSRGARRCRLEPATSTRSGSRTSARRRCCGSARPAGRSRRRSSGRTGAPPSAAASSTPS